MSNTHTKNDVIYLQSFHDTYLANFNIVVSSNSNLYELVTTKEGGLHFISSDNGNYYFDVKVEHCRVVSFVNNVIDCGCLGCVLLFFFITSIEKL